MNRKLALVPTLLVCLAIASSAFARQTSPAVGTWKLVMSEKSLKSLPKGMKPPVLTMTMIPGGSMTGQFTFGKQSSKMKGTWKLKGDKLTLRTTHVDGKPEKAPKDEVVTLSKDKKSFDLPKSNQMGKMVKQ